MQVRSFTSFQMFHTHAPLPRGCFCNDCMKVSKALICSLRQDVANEAKSKHREWDAIELSGLLRLDIGKVVHVATSH